MRVTIEGYDLPGGSFCAADGAPYDQVHVGVQIRDDPESLLPGDTNAARWNIDIGVITTAEGDVDFSGPAVHGKRGDRFIYLTWGNVDSDGHFEMFRRAKLMLNRVDPGLIAKADTNQTALVARVRLSDQYGTPRCARVDPPDIEWTAT